MGAACAGAAAGVWEGVSGAGVAAGVAGVVAAGSLERFYNAFSLFEKMTDKGTFEIPLFDHKLSEKVKTSPFISPKNSRSSLKT